MFQDPHSLLTLLAQSQEEKEPPSSLPSPFATRPHAIAIRAAEILQQELFAGTHDGLGHDFDALGEGKMLAVLVVRDSALGLGFLRAGSGMLGGTWRPAGFVPPVFDDDARDRFWPAGQEQLQAVAEEIHALKNSEEARQLASAKQELKDQHEQAARELRATHKANKKRRAVLRSCDTTTETELLTLSHQSQEDRRAGKALRAKQRIELGCVLDEHRAFDQRIREKRSERASISNALLAKIQAGYQIANAKGETSSLAALYPGVPPGGSGDCAGPKLLAYAYKLGLEPVAFAEFWWGAPPPGGGRHSGQYYPACRGKCGPLLAFMLQGLDHDPPPLFASTTPKTSSLTTIFEDAHIFAINKPEAMLSVPGATSLLRDSVLTRLRDAHESSDRPLSVHRLDRDTSGVLVLAKSPKAHRAMQALFANRTIEKRYVAWLDGIVVTDRGRISLPLRVDIDDRPRQVVDKQHGKEAITDYVVLERTSTHTKVAFFPRTGRSHQLRVHAAHPHGLAAPITGDRLYGTPQQRLYLHAESLCFVHPITGLKIVIECPLPPHFDSPFHRLTGTLTWETLRAYAQGEPDAQECT